MSKRLYTYELKDKEYPEDIVKVVYTSNSCSCSYDCYEDELDFYIEDEWYGKIELRGKQKEIIFGLLTSEYDIKEIK